MEKKKKIFVVDDHPMMRRGYRSLIGGESDLTVAGEAGGAVDALRLIEETDPDLVIVDIFLEGMNGIDFVKRLHRVRPEMPVLMVSMHDETLYAERALQAGARGYLMKSEDDDHVLRAIRQVLAGHYYLSDVMATRLLTQMSGRNSSPAGGTVLHRLSDRELEVFELIGRGLSTRDIAERLHISPKTVESHRARMKSKLSVDSANELLRRAVKWVESAGETV
jgi:DNA-binding NarL/FixJ family response regulator